MKRKPKYCVNVKELRKYAINSSCYNINDIAVLTAIHRNTIGGILNGKVYPSSYAMNK